MTSVISFTDEGTGLRDYRVSLAEATTAPRTPRGWLFVVAIAFLLGFYFGAQLRAAEPRVQLQVRPQFLLQRGDVDVQARIARSAENRALLVSWDSDAGAAGSRQFELEGDRARVLFQWWNRAQPPGHYIFEARLYDNGGRQVGFDRREILQPEEPR